MSPKTTPAPVKAKVKAKMRAKKLAKKLAALTQEETKKEGTPSKPLLGILPLARVIPQDLHSIGDYMNGFRVIAAGLFGRTEKGRAASLALGASIVSVSLMTDYRLSPVKAIPIEAHEAIDYLWGAAAIAAPFVLGYAKRDRMTATAHVLVGAGHILMSLFTDYRSAKAKKEAAPA
jgi:hypothetical protein